MDVNKIEPYVDCVVLHQDGTVRIGRLNHTRTSVQLASYQRCQNQYCWPVEEVVTMKAIDHSVVYDPN